MVEKHLCSTVNGSVVMEGDIAILVSIAVVLIFNVLPSFRLAAFSTYIYSLLLQVFLGLSVSVTAVALAFMALITHLHQSITTLELCC